MTRAEIEERIKEIVNRPLGVTTIRGKEIKQIDTEGRSVTIIELTDLFIQLSNERCVNQKEICFNKMMLGEEMSYNLNAVLNAPLPEIK